MTGEFSAMMNAEGWMGEALPYVQRYFGKTVVVKYGGGAMLNEGLKNSVMRDITLLSAIGVRVALVHGGGPEIDTLLSKLGKESVFIGGLRHTDAETMDVVSMVLAGKVNKSLVALIQTNKGKAVGLCGVDAGMIMAEKFKGGGDLGFVGQISKVNPEPVTMALERGMIPVIATIGIDEGGQTYNINADTAAAAIAGAIHADRLILMTDVAGVLANRDDEGSVIPDIDIKDVPGLISAGVISGGMIPKAECCVSAVGAGLTAATIIDGRVEHAILIELFSDKGVGTLFHA
jgi:acetylglutamate kinase